MKVIKDKNSPNNLSWDTISAKDLLFKFIELINLRPETRKWKEFYFVEDSRELKLYKQLRVLFDVFGIRWNPDYFMSGMFIDEENPKYDALLERIAPELHGFGRPNFRLRRYLLPHCFRILLDYRLTLTNPLLFCSGVTAASGLIGYAYYKAYNLNQIIKEKLSSIDDLLADIISPEGRAFKLEVLINEHHYPDYNNEEDNYDNW